MKKIFFTVLTVITSLAVFSQDKNVILKWAPGSLASGKVTLGTEYNFRKKQSIEVYVGIPTTVRHEFSVDGNPGYFDSKAFSAMAGYRYYVGKRSLHGFYVEPYAKYVGHEANGEATKFLLKQTAHFLTNTSYNGIGVGAQLGAQFLIAKRVSVDFFLGPEINSSNFSLSAVDVASNIPWNYVEAKEAEDYLRKVIHDAPIIGTKAEFKVDKDKKRVDGAYSGYLPGIRVGVAVGFKL